MIQRTESEMKAYVDGYNACFEMYTESLQSLNLNGKDGAYISEVTNDMKNLKAAINALVEVVVESEDKE